MNRQIMPPVSATPDTPAQVTEIRMPMPSGRHNLRNGRGVRP